MPNSKPLLLYIYRTCTTILIFGFLALFCLCTKQKSTQRTITIISPHSPEIKDEFGRGFTQWHQEKYGEPIHVQWLDVGGTGEAIEYIRSRASSKSYGVDVFFGGGDAPFIKLGKAGLLKPIHIPDSIRNNFPATLYGTPLFAEDFTWYGAALSSFGIMFNKRVCEQKNLLVPKSWIDLANSKYSGNIACADPRYSGTIHLMFEIILQTYGWQKGWNILYSMAGNMHSFSRSASIVVKNVALGDAAIGMAIDFYAHIEINRYGKENCGFILPENETIVSPDGIGVLTTTSDSLLSARFLMYVLSEGQKLWMLKQGVPGGPHTYSLCRYSVDTLLYKLPDSIKAVVQNPYSMPSLFPYQSSVASKRWDIVNDLITATMIAPQKTLQKIMKNASLTSDTSNLFFDVPITQEEALVYAKTWSSKENIAVRIKTIDTWTTQFLKTTLQKNKPVPYL